MNFLNELKFDLGSEAMKDVMDACKASLENYCVIVETGDTADIKGFFDTIPRLQ